MTAHDHFRLKLRAALFLAACAMLPYALNLWSPESLKVIYRGFIFVDACGHHCDFRWGRRALAGATVGAIVFLGGMVLFPCGSWVDRDSSGFARAAEGSAVAVLIAVATIMLAPWVFVAVANFTGLVPEAAEAARTAAPEVPAVSRDSNLAQDAAVRAVGLALFWTIFMYFYWLAALVLVGWWAIPMAAVAGAFVYRFAGVARLHEEAG